MQKSSGTSVFFTKANSSTEDFLGEPPAFAPSAHGGRRAVRSSPLLLRRALRALVAAAARPLPSLSLARLCRA